MNIEALPHDGIDSVVTIGKFDGVHRGHRAVIDSLRRVANGRRVVAVTFDRHPLELFSPHTAPRPLLSIAQKIEALHEAGADRVVVIPFTQETAELLPRDFVDTVIVEGLSASLVMVGADFRFGHNGAGTVSVLRELGAARGFSVEVQDDVCRDGGRDKVSSTAIRLALDSGDVTSAAELLGRPHRMRGLVVHGHQRGRNLGYPTVNLEENSEGYIPAAGVYAGRVSVGGSTYIAGISVGKNPTFHDVTRNQVEAHAMDAEFDAYGQVAEIEFTHRVRDLTAFTTVDDLIVAIHRDMDVIRALVARGELLI
ncbi:riboflavin kinase/FMN adenylyltransferase [Microbacteriaceae bacterium MWH-Ta3]|nr:riboflavin kinase/FMN adenylyltransferase [Microbacteriaceae bacterium MWH-Ta3]